MVAGVPVTNAESASGSEIRNFLPSLGVHRSRTMIMMAPREYSVLAERMAAAAQRDPAWFESYVARHSGADGLLPYHPNLGVTEAEYQRFIELMDQFRLGEIERGELSVRAGPGGSLTISAGGHAGYLSGITIYPEYVQTSHGLLTHREEINQNDPTSPTGRWRGVQWSNEGRPDVPLVKLALGRRESGEMVIYYDVTPSEDETLFLLYD